MKRKLTTLALTFAVATSAAVAAPHGKDKQSRKARNHAVGHVGPTEEQRFDRMAERLDLSEGQKHQVRDLRKRFHGENRQLQDRLHSTIREYRELKRVNDPRAASLAVEIDRLKADLQRQRQAQHREMLSLLTPQQRERAEQEFGRAHRHGGAQHQKGEKRQKTEKQQRERGSKKR